MSLICEECSKLEKLKNLPEVAVKSQWAYLPSLPLTAVFGMLKKEHRKIASVVCKNWRDNYFLPRWWKSITISIEPNELEKASFLTNTCGRTVREARIVLKSLSNGCLHELINLLSRLSRNNNLKSLTVDPSPCLTEKPYSQDSDRFVELAEITDLLKLCLPKLSEFTMRCKEVLSICMETILANLDPSLVTILRLATAKDDPANRYRVYKFDPALFKSFTKLEVLSIGYDNVSDELLDILATATQLKLTIPYRCAFDGTLVVTNNAWIRFIQHHPKTELYSVVIQPLRGWVCMPFTSSRYYFRKPSKADSIGIQEKPGFRLQQWRPRYPK